MADWRHRGSASAAMKELVCRELTFRHGQPTEVIVRKPKSQRSLDMNAYLHAVPFALLAEHFGDSVEGTKLDLMGEFWGWTAGPISGRPVPIKPQTSSMSVEESAKFLDWLIPWAAQEHGVLIPLPGESDAAA